MRRLLDDFQKRRDRGLGGVTLFSCAFDRPLGITAQDAVQSLYFLLALGEQGGRIGYRVFSPQRLGDEGACKYIHDRLTNRPRRPSAVFDNGAESIIMQDERPISVVPMRAIRFGRSDDFPLARPLLPRQDLAHLTPPWPKGRVSRRIDNGERGAA